MSSIREGTEVTWSGRHRAPLTGQGIIPGRCRIHCPCGSAAAAPQRLSEAGRAPGGALLVGDAATVAEKIRALSDALSDASRVTLQMSVAALPHTRAIRAIEILGREVAPLLRKND